MTLVAFCECVGDFSTVVGIHDFLPYCAHYFLTSFAMSISCCVVKDLVSSRVYTPVRQTKPWRWNLVLAIFPSWRAMRPATRF